MDEKTVNFYGLFATDKRIVGISYASMVDNIGRIFLYVAGIWLVVLAASVADLILRRPTESLSGPAIASVSAFELAWIFGLGRYLADRRLRARSREGLRELEKVSWDLEIWVDQVMSIELSSKRVAPLSTERTVRFTMQGGQTFTFRCGRNQFKRMGRFGRVLVSRNPSIHLVENLDR